MRRDYETAAASPPCCCCCCVLLATGTASSDCSRRARSCSLFSTTILLASPPLQANASTGLPHHTNGALYSVALRRLATFCHFYFTIISVVVCYFFSGCCCDVFQHVFIPRRTLLGYNSLPLRKNNNCHTCHRCSVISRSESRSILQASACNYHSLSLFHYHCSL